MIRDNIFIFFTKGAWRIWVWLLLLYFVVIMFLKG